MGPVLQNTDDLVRMPYGCGEQNMVNFVPTIVVTKYLTTTERMNPRLLKRSRQYIEAGYQRQLSYLRYDNSFSAFGNRDRTGSTWLTAFVVKSFTQASPYTYIDQDVIQRSINFLKRQRTPEGSFQENGMVHNTFLQGGSKKAGVPRTAYILSALLEAGEKDTRISQNFVAGNLDEIANSSYALSIATYALHLANHSDANRAFELLEKRGVEKYGLKSWNESSEAEARRPWYWHRPRTLDVEATAYALLTYIQRDLLVEAQPIVRWLVSKQNSNGGYSSTQDTVMALQALGAYAEKVFSADTDLVVNVQNGKAKHSFEVRPENGIVLQQFELKNFQEPVVLDTTGRGIAFAQLSWRYHLAPSAEDPDPFTCDQTIKRQPGRKVQVSLCCKYNKKDRSNMAVVEVSSLSGYTIDSEELAKLLTTPGIQRAELEKAETKAIIYIESLGKQPLCFDVDTEQTYPVAEQKPGRIAIYDYYVPEDRVENDYTLKNTVSLNEACPDCWNNIPSKSELNFSKSS